MLEELDTAIETYHAKWHQLVAKRQNKAFFQSLKPTAVAWKVADLPDLDARMASLREHCDQIHSGWVNERWLLTLHLKDAELSCGVRVIKLMQRRPGSTDPIGLDHLDFLITTEGDAKAVLASEPDLKWSEEKNGDNCQWLSVWFDGTEAKLRRDTVLQVCADELLDTQKPLLDESS
jgi:plasmid maintenance system killer protein